MGAAPRASLLSLALPEDFPVAEFDELIEGFAALADSSGAALVGGNIARSPGPIVIDVTVLGSVKRRRWLERGGGQAGDELYVTGDLGAAAAGLAMREAADSSGELEASERACIDRYERPEPRLRMGQVVDATAPRRPPLTSRTGWRTGPGRWLRRARLASCSRRMPFRSTRARAGGRPDPAQTP